MDGSLLLLGALAATVLAPLVCALVPRLRRWASYLALGVVIELIVGIVGAYLAPARSSLAGALLGACAGAVLAAWLAGRANRSLGLPVPGKLGVAGVMAAYLALGAASLALAVLSVFERHGEDLSGSYHSAQVPARAERLRIMGRYFRLPAQPEDAEFDLEYFDNGPFAPSDWNLRAVARVAPGQIPAWLAAFDHDEPRQAAHGADVEAALRCAARLRQLHGWPEPTSAPVVYGGVRDVRIVHAPEGQVAMLRSSESGWECE